jgi:hypothetical protein
VRWAKRTLRGLAALLAAVLAVLLLSHSASAAERTIGERERTSVVREVDGREDLTQPDVISAPSVVALHHALRPGVVRPLREPAALVPAPSAAEEQTGPPRSPVEPQRQSRSASPALLQVFRC